MTYVMHDERVKTRKRKRMGRPPLPASKRKSAVVRVRLTPGERRRFEAMARSNGTGLSEVLMKPWRKGD
jgi:hypothetical protein